MLPSSPGSAASAAAPSLRKPSFAEVLLGAQQGERWANTELWLRFAPRVAAYLRVRGSAEPDDLTSEVFLTVFARLKEFAGDEGKFASFVFTIAHRRLVDELRKRAIRGDSIEWSEGTDRRSSPSAEEQAVSQLGDADAAAVLETLPPAQRDVLVLRIMGDLTVEQVGLVLEKQPGAVKALQRRGLATLRKKFGLTRTPSGVPNDSKV
jgi:RNA polymerase sigma factor (sigma-70 family)